MTKSSVMQHLELLPQDERLIQVEGLVKQQIARVEGILERSMARTSALISQQMERAHLHAQKQATTENNDNDSKSTNTKNKDNKSHNEDGVQYKTKDGKTFKSVGTNTNNRVKILSWSSFNKDICSEAGKVCNKGASFETGMVYDEEASSETGMVCKDASSEIGRESNMQSTADLKRQQFAGTKSWRTDQTERVHSIETTSNMSIPIETVVCVESSDSYQTRCAESAEQTAAIEEQYDNPGKIFNQVEAKSNIVIPLVEQETPDLCTSGSFETHAPTVQQISTITDNNVVKGTLYLASASVDSIETAVIDRNAVSAVFRGVGQGETDALESQNKVETGALNYGISHSENNINTDEHSVPNTTEPVVEVENSSSISIDDDPKIVEKIENTSDSEALVEKQLPELNKSTSCQDVSGSVVSSCKSYKHNKSVTGHSKIKTPDSETSDQSHLSESISVKHRQKRFKRKSKNREESLTTSESDTSSTANSRHSRKPQISPHSERLNKSRSTDSSVSEKPVSQLLKRELNVQNHSESEPYTSLAEKHLAQSMTPKQTISHFNCSREQGRVSNQQKKNVRSMSSSSSFSELPVSQLKTEEQSSHRSSSNAKLSNTERQMTDDEHADKALHSPEGSSSRKTKASIGGSLSEKPVSQLGMIAVSSHHDSIKTKQCTELKNRPTNLSIDTDESVNAKTRHRRSEHRHTDHSDDSSLSTKSEPKWSSNRPISDIPSSDKSLEEHPTHTSEQSLNNHEPIPTANVKRSSDNSLSQRLQRSNSNDNSSNSKHVDHIENVNSQSKLVNKAESCESSVSEIPVSQIPSERLKNVPINESCKINASSDSERISRSQHSNSSSETSSEQIPLVKKKIDEKKSEPENDSISSSSQNSTEQIPVSQLLKRNISERGVCSSSSKSSRSSNHPIFREYQKLNEEHSDCDIQISNTNGNENQNDFRVSDNRKSKCEGLEKKSLSFEVQSLQEQLNLDHDIPLSEPVPGTNRGAQDFERSLIPQEEGVRRYTLMNTQSSHEERSVSHLVNERKETKLKNQDSIPDSTQDVYNVANIPERDASDCDNKSNGTNAYPTSTVTDTVPNEMKGSIPESSQAASPQHNSMPTYSRNDNEDSNQNELNIESAQLPESVAQNQVDAGCPRERVIPNDQHALDDSSCTGGSFKDHYHKVVSALEKHLQNSACGKDSKGLEIQESTSEVETPKSLSVVETPKSVSALPPRTKRDVSPARQVIRSLSCDNTSISNNESTGLLNTEPDKRKYRKHKKFVSDNAESVCSRDKFKHIEVEVENTKGSGRSTKSKSKGQGSCSVDEFPNIDTRSSANSTVVSVVCSRTSADHTESEEQSKPNPDVNTKVKQAQDTVSNYKHNEVESNSTHDINLNRETSVLSTDGDDTSNLEELDSSFYDRSSPRQNDMEQHVGSMTDDESNLSFSEESSTLGSKSRKSDTASKSNGKPVNPDVKAIRSDTKPNVVKKQEKGSNSSHDPNTMAKLAGSSTKTRAVTRLDYASDSSVSVPLSLDFYSDIVTPVTSLRFVLDEWSEPACNPFEDKHKTKRINRKKPPPGLCTLKSEATHAVRRTSTPSTVSQNPASFDETDLGGYNEDLSSSVLQHSFMNKSLQDKTTPGVSKKQLKSKLTLMRTSSPKPLDCPSSSKRDSNDDSTFSYMDSSPSNRSKNSSRRDVLVDSSTQPDEATTTEDVASSIFPEDVEDGTDVDETILIDENDFSEMTDYLGTSTDTFTRIENPNYKP